MLKILKYNKKNSRNTLELFLDRRKLIQKNKASTVSRILKSVKKNGDKAVLNYERHDFLYFVANPNQPGYHLFATNVHSHNRNKKVYTDWLNRNRIYR